MPCARSDDDVYYNSSLGGRGMLSAIADAFQRWNRARKAEFIAGFIHEHALNSVLVVGAGGGSQEGYSNLIERTVSRVAGVVVFSGVHVSTNWSPYVACDGRALPFPDGSFDLVLSNAVIEHVGDKEDQERFVREHSRVAQRYVITTPNRYFPVESHTRRLFVHWLPPWRRRQTVFTRLLSKREFQELLPPGARIKGSRVAPTFLAHGSSDSRADRQQREGTSSNE
jgi:SAM-dependent methyltransferase